MIATVTFYKDTDPNVINTVDIKRDASVDIPQILQSAQDVLDMLASEVKLLKKWVEVYIAKGSGWVYQSCDVVTIQMHENENNFVGGGMKRRNEVKLPERIRNAWCV